MNENETKIPTAEEFLLGKEIANSSSVQEKWEAFMQLDFSMGDILEKLKGFAELHVEAALKSAVDNIEINCDSSDVFQSVNEDSILNSYPLENIK